MIWRIFAASLMALLAGSLVERARAEQAIFCEDGSLVQVKADALDAAKRKNPCVARHFGQRVVASAIPLPVRKPAPAKIRTTQTAAPAPKDEKVKSSYRMVRILNAESPAERWFQPGQ